MAYTDAQVKELREIKGLDYEKAKAFGEKHGISPRSVVAKARALEIPYASQKPGTKKAKASNVRRKSEIAQNINDLLDMTLTSLDKLTAKDLEALEVRVKEMVDA